jgi:hypothetical protein
MNAKHAHDIYAVLAGFSFRSQPAAAIMIVCKIFTTFY